MLSVINWIDREGTWVEESFPPVYDPRKLPVYAEATPKVTVDQLPNWVQNGAE